MPKLHEVWPGNNRFLCGCCISGPSKEVGGIIYIQFCILAIVIPFCIFVAGITWEVSPALPLLFFLSLVATQIFLVLTSCSDPGIIPRRPFLEKRSRQFTSFLQAGTQTKFCQTCQIYRSDRASHCSTCQNCVEVFDHHCGTLGNCIGKRNYRFFVLFLASALLSMIMAIINMAAYFIRRSEQNENQTVAIVVASVIAGIITIPLFCFFGFHLFLALTGNTTRTYLKNLPNIRNSSQNQWCNVEEPLFDPFEEISEEAALEFDNKLRQMREPRALGQAIRQNGSNKQML